MRRREPAAGPVTVELGPSSTALRPDIGSPCWSRAARTRALRNNGTGEPPADAVGLDPVIHRIEGGTLTLPLTDDHKLFPRAG